jgi:uncharacterized protein (UPF0548 family)
VFFTRRPSDRRIRDFLTAQRNQPFSYQQVGATRERAPQGFNVDRSQIQLGSGEVALERAKAAIRDWKMFAMPWIQLCWPAAPIEMGSTVGVLVSHIGFWSLNAARIVYIIDEKQRYGFAYGTLPGHAEIGEERFSVELRQDETVWYEIYAFSRPRGLSRCASTKLRARFAKCHAARSYRSRKLTSTVAITGTGLPSLTPGLKRHLATASMAF